MKALYSLVLISGLAGAAQAQSMPNSTAHSSYVSVMSKAGAPVPRPSVPIRYVGLPSGAAAGYDYYYGYGYRGYSGGAASPSYANEPAPSTSSSLPGYDTRPRSSRSSDSLTNRKRHRD